MTIDSAAIIRRVDTEYQRGDLAALVEFVDSELEWTGLDCALGAPDRRSHRAQGLA